MNIIIFVTSAIVKVKKGKTTIKITTFTLASLVISEAVFCHVIN